MRKKKKTRSSYRNKSHLNPESGAKKKRKLKRKFIENQKEKFRKSREWKDFRSHMAVVANHRDYITGRRLAKGFNVHHLRTDQDEEAYCDISNESEFMALNSYCHKMLHYLFTYYQKDPTIMNRLKEILDRMCELSGNYAIEPIENIEETIGDGEPMGDCVEEGELENPIENIEVSSSESEMAQEVISNEEITSEQEVTSRQQQLPQSM